MPTGMAMRSWSCPSTSSGYRSIAFVGWQLYGEPLDPFVLFGSLIIIGGIVWNLRAEARFAPAMGRPK